MTATLALSAAILKRKYPTGRLPKANFQDFPLISNLTKHEDWTGDDKAIAIQTENPQGSSADYGTAVGSLAQGNYVRFLLTRVEHYGVARIRDHALKAAASDDGALVKLWDNETKGISQTETKMLEIYAFGNGSGTLGKIASGQGTATVQLATPEDAAKFDLGMRCQIVSDATLAPTVRPGFVVITAIDRKGGTLTAAAAWNTYVPTIQANDFICRAGDAANTITASGPSVIWGMGSYIVGGTTPGTLATLNRNQDPVRLAGQLYAAANQNMGEAIIDAESLLTVQGRRTPKVLWAHVRDIAQMRKTLDGKTVYPKVNVPSAVADVSFKAIEFEGDDGDIKIMTSPFIQRNQAFLGTMEAFALDSLGPAPQLDNFDNNDFLRVASDAAQEVRFATFANLECNSPVDWVQITGFGA